MDLTGGISVPNPPKSILGTEPLNDITLASEPNVPEYVGKNTRIVIYSVYAVILINWLMVDWVIAFTQIN